MPRFYFDHNATTPVAPEVLNVFVPALTEVYGNPSSIHQHGQAAKRCLETARRQVAGFLACEPAELVFVSGGTEANNLAILGTVRHAEQICKHVITSAIEHPSVLEACAQLEREGVEVTYIRPSTNGLVDPDAVRAALRPSTVLISLMHANNETGTLQPVEECARIAHEAGALFHSDGVQAAGKLPTPVKALGADLYSISAHKMYAPKGTGGLYIRKGVALKPMLFGGRHERERRAGTENVPGAVAFGQACALASANLSTETPRLAALRDRLEARVLEQVPDCRVNGERTVRVANTSNLCFEGIDGEALTIALDLAGFSVSAGSACSSGAVTPSHVLLAMGLSHADARASIRISLGYANTEQQVDALAEAIGSCCARLRKHAHAPVAHV